MRIAFLGLGRMGLPMARNLLGREHTVTVYNRTPGRAETLAALGAEVATTVAEAVRNAEVAITMLSDDAAMNEVAQGQTGLLRHLPARAIHICMGSMGIEVSAALATAHAQADQGYLAAPVFGRPDTAATRHLWILAGGPEPQVNRCRPIFEALGQGYTRVGPNPALAHALKLGGNLLTMAMELAASEILPYATKAGLPPADYLRLLNTAIFRSHVMDGYGSIPARPSFDPEDQTLDLAASELLAQACKDLGADIPPVDLLHARLQAASARGWGEQDLAELTRTFHLETGGEEPPALTRATPPSPPRPKPLHPPPPRTVIQSEEPLPSPEPKSAPSSAKTARKAEPAKLKPPQVLSANRFDALEDGAPVTLDLNRSSHFELIHGQVWAWSEGRRYRTFWTSLDEVESTFHHVMFLRSKRHVLLRPEAVLELRPTFGGGAKARVGGDVELDVGRTALARLKDLLGL
ncbi:MAG: NAD-binding protein [Geothrix sp.]|uniref:NAD(P)-binding domain-containing protein n=1 Tax=Geothrix sp. TaxID=1962974 RepID=UPI0017D1BD3B|nr:NAD(P)-binding domain-containing protein [Geothrix sp.]NWJ42539.1 NAD-binding protein [Geothrix sp.]WIL19500.1 MAG: NAD(P)-binding domain-containing protein [Geothrix sp.]